MTSKATSRPSFSWTSRARLLSLSLICVLVGAATDVRSQDCKDPAIVERETPVFSSPAREFNTASGWVYGAPVAVLAANIRVFICGNRTVRFGVIWQQWFEVAYWDGKKWLHGWVVAANLRRAATDAQTRLAWMTLPAVLIPSARAAVPVIEVNPPSDALAPAVPALPVPVPSGQAAPVEGSGLITFYAALFGFMILGMLAKVAFDVATAVGRTPWKARARAGVVPLVVSPIVFLGIMRAADATAAATVGSFISVACFAFQNGFFWHTVFDRSAGAPDTPAPVR